MRQREQQESPAFAELRQKASDLLTAANSLPADAPVLRVFREVFVALGMRGLEAKSLPPSLLYSTLGGMRRAFTTRIKKPPVTLQERDILRHVASFHPNEATAAHICGCTMIGRDSVNALLYSLHRKGFLHRVLRRRVGFYTLTASGHKVVETFNLLAPIQATAPGSILPRPILEAPRRRGNVPNGV